MTISSRGIERAGGETHRAWLGPAFEKAAQLFELALDLSRRLCPENPSNRVYVTGEIGFRFTPAGDGIVVTLTYRPTNRVSQPDADKYYRAELAKAKKLVGGWLLAKLSEISTIDVELWTLDPWHEEVPPVLFDRVMVK